MKRSAVRTSSLFVRSSDDSSSQVRYKFFVKKGVPSYLDLYSSGIQYGAVLTYLWNMCFALMANCFMKCILIDPCQSSALAHFTRFAYGSLACRVLQLPFVWG